MEKVLSQEQIDAMVRAAREGSGTTGRQQAVVVPWNAREAGQLGRQQLQSITILHEDFATSLTHSVAAYLRVAFTAKLVSAEHLNYGEFLQRVPDLTYLATCRLMPVDSSVLLQLDLSAAFPLIDVLLGGEGRGKIPERGITAMEAQILETIVKIICRELRNAWQALSLEFEFGRSEEPEQLQQWMAAEEKTLALSFELNVAESRGMLNLIFPAVVSNALLRKIAAERTRGTRRSSADWSGPLRTHLLGCSFTAALAVETTPASFRELMELSPGGLLRLRTPVGSPANLRIGNVELFSAAVARRAKARAGHILSACDQAKEPTS